MIKYYLVKYCISITVDILWAYLIDVCLQVSGTNWLHVRWPRLSHWTSGDSGQLSHLLLSIMQSFKVSVKFQLSVLIWFKSGSPIEQFSNCLHGQPRYSQCIINTLTRSVECCRCVLAYSGSSTQLNSSLFKSCSRKAKKDTMQCTDKQF